MLRTKLSLLNINGWIVESNFNDGTIGDRADNKDWGSGKATTGAYYAGTQTLFSAARPHTGALSAECKINEGQSAWGVWHLSWEGLPGVTQGQEVWMRAWFYHDPNFEWNPASGGKGLRLQCWDTDGDRNKYYFDAYLSAGGITMGNGPGNIDNSFITNNGGDAPSNSPQLVNWEHVEMYIKYHSTPGQGIFRCWRNDSLWFEDTDTITLPRSNDKGAVNAHIYTVFTNNWPGTNKFPPYGPLKDETSYVDEVIITSDTPSGTDAAGNAYIGSGGTIPEPIANPKPPTSFG